MTFLILIQINKFPLRSQPLPRTVQGEDVVVVLKSPKLDGDKLTFDVEVVGRRTADPNAMYAGAAATLIRLVTDGPGIARPLRGAWKTLRARCESHKIQRLSAGPAICVLLGLL